MAEMVTETVKSVRLEDYMRLLGAAHGIIDGLEREGWINEVLRAQLANSLTDLPYRIEEWQVSSPQA